MIVDQGDMDAGVTCLRSGASDYISKPINSGALEVALQRAYERRKICFKFKNYEASLELANKNKALFQQLFDEVPCYISIQDRNFRLTGANKQFLVIISDHTVTKYTNTGLNPAVGVLSEPHSKMKFPIKPRKSLRHNMENSTMF